MRTVSCQWPWVGCLSRFTETARMVLKLSEIGVRMVNNVGARFRTALHPSVQISKVILPFASRATDTPAVTVRFPLFRYLCSGHCFSHLKTTPQSRTFPAKDCNSSYPLCPSLRAISSSRAATEASRLANSTSSLRALPAFS